MENIVEKYIIVEILEKVYRLKKFIGTQKPMRKYNSNEATMQVFEIGLQKILEGLQQPVQVLRADSLSEHARFVLNRKLSTTFLLLTGFHGKLKYINSDWVRPETYTFTKRLVHQFPSAHTAEAINIILSNEYTFKENNLINKFNEILEPSNVDDIPENIKYPTFFLPKIEYSNPLNWAILAHEMAHINEGAISSFISDTAMIPPGTSNDHADILRQWAEEIYCDIFAVNLLGPAYFASFVSFALATTGFGGNGKNSKSHPSNMLRIRILHEHLTRNNADIKISNADLGASGMNDFFQKMIEDFDKNDRKGPGRNLDNGHEIDDLTHFLDHIRTKSKSIVDGLTIDAHELGIIDSLKNKLERGIPIGSYQGYDKAFTKEKLHDLESNFDEVKKSISEQGSSIRQILNAGWIKKISSTFPKVVEFIFGNQPQSLNDCLNIFCDSIEESDDRLLKSIETSELFFLIEQ